MMEYKRSVASQLNDNGLETLKNRFGMIAGMHKVVI